MRGAYDRVRHDLLTLRNVDGYWEGQLNGSVLATATAISALAVVQRRGGSGVSAGAHCEPDWVGLIYRGLEWLADHQNADGGWGHMPGGPSCLDTTLLVLAAFQLTGVPAAHDDLLAQAQAFVDRAGGIPGLRRQSTDRSWLALVLTNCALAEQVAWRDVPQLPFERAGLERASGVLSGRALGWSRRLLAPVACRWWPAVIAAGQIRFQQLVGWNPLTAAWRRSSIGPGLKQLEQRQAADGSFDGQVALTGFVVMSLASMARTDLAWVSRAVDFLIGQARPDGSWPSARDVAVRSTAQSVLALSLDGHLDAEDVASVDWLLAAQQQSVEPGRKSGGGAGGWSWSAAPGAAATVVDTATVLMALRRYYDTAGRDESQRSRVAAAARSGATWLVAQQCRDGGWPVFGSTRDRQGCDPCAADATAWAVRSLHGWRDLGGTLGGAFDLLLDGAIARGLEYLQETQANNGSWLGCVAGRPAGAETIPPVATTAVVVRAWAECGLADKAPAQRGLAYLTSVQQPSGGWGGPPMPIRSSARAGLPDVSTLDDTCLALQAYLSMGLPAGSRDACQLGLRWLGRAIDQQRHRNPSSYGVHLTKLWFGEQTDPLVAALTVLSLAPHYGLELPESTSPPAVTTPSASPSGVSTTPSAVAQPA